MGRLQTDPSQRISENALFALGYEPTLDAATRWSFLQSIGMPQLTKDGAINSLQALLDSLEIDTSISRSVIGNMITDLAQMRRFVGTY